MKHRMNGHGYQDYLNLKDNNQIIDDFHAFDLNIEEKFKEANRNDKILVTSADI